MRIRRWQAASGLTAATDEVATEEPLEIRVNGAAVAVVMRTPGHDNELAAGFLVSEGVVKRPSDIAAIRPNPRNRLGNVLDVILAPEVELDLARLTRHVFGASSCGLCGKVTIDAVRTSFPRIRRDKVVVRGETLVQLTARMREAQTVFGVTGGLHAAAIFQTTGELLALREDVGRHNAVDKLLGRAVLDGRMPLADMALVVSGRASFEILQKALAGGIPIVAAVGAPSSLAVELARRSNQTLIGFLRDGRFNVYAGQGRVRA